MAFASGASRDLPWPTPTYRPTVKQVIFVFNGEVLRIGFDSLPFSWKLDILKLCCPTGAFLLFECRRLHLQPMLPSLACLVARERRPLPLPRASPPGGLASAIAEETQMGAEMSTGGGPVAGDGWCSGLSSEGSTLAR